MKNFGVPTQKRTTYSLLFCIMCFWSMGLWAQSMTLDEAARLYAEQRWQHSQAHAAVPHGPLVLAPVEERYPKLTEAEATALWHMKHLPSEAMEMTGEEILNMWIDRPRRWMSDAMEIRIGRCSHEEMEQLAEHAGNVAKQFEVRERQNTFIRTITRLFPPDIILPIIYDVILEDSDASISQKSKFVQLLRSVQHDNEFIADVLYDIYREFRALHDTSERPHNMQDMLDDAHLALQSAGEPGLQRLEQLGLKPSLRHQQLTRGMEEETISAALLKYRGEPSEENRLFMLPELAMQYQAQNTTSKIFIDNEIDRSLEDPDPRRRRLAVIAAGNTRSPNYLQRLEEIAENDPFSSMVYREWNEDRTERIDQEVEFYEIRLLAEQGVEKIRQTMPENILATFAAQWKENLLRSRESELEAVLSRMQAAGKDMSHALDIEREQQLREELELIRSGYAPEAVVASIKEQETTAIQVSTPQTTVQQQMPNLVNNNNQFPNQEYLEMQINIYDRAIELTKSRLENTQDTSQQKLLQDILKGQQRERERLINMLEESRKAYEAQKQPF